MSVKIPVIVVKKFGNRRSFFKSKNIFKNNRISKLSEKLICNRAVRTNDSGFNLKGHDQPQTTVIFVLN